MAKTPRRDKGEPMPLERVIHIAEFRAGLRTFVRRSERIAQRWQLTPQRYLLLLIVKGASDGSERVTFSEAAERMQLSKNTVTDLVSRAEEVGLVFREPSDHDQRVVYIRLTEEGERRLCGALIENEGYRRELVQAFEELAASFKTAARVR